jgi:hypothetical protein
MTTKLKGTIESCTCKYCVGACEHNPGWMTPEEATCAIDAGYAQRLMADWLEPSAECNNDERIIVLCPASIGCEGCAGPEMEGGFMAAFTGWCKGRCTFLKKGLCEIHTTPFKPLQCRETLVCSKKDNNAASNNYQIARLWQTPEALVAVARWQKITDADMP